MPRKRLNDNPLIVYTYRAYLPGITSFVQAPDFMKDEARACMDYWNDLVRLGRQNTEEYQTIIADSPAVIGAQEELDGQNARIEKVSADIKHEHMVNRSKKQTPTIKALRDRLGTLKEERKRIRHRLKTAKQQARKEKKEAIDAHNMAWDETVNKTMRTGAKAPNITDGSRERILDDFKTAYRENGKKGIELRYKFWPLREVHFRERYPPGLELHKAQKGGKKFQLGAIVDAPGRRPRRECRMRVCKEGDRQIAFQIAYHRPLPEGVRIKSVDLVGRQVVQRGFRLIRTQGHWQPPPMKWTLLITCEVPKPDFYQPVASQAACGIDIGYRYLNEKIRVAALAGDDGYEEILELPEQIVRKWTYGYTVLHPDLDHWTNKIKKSLGEMGETVRDRDLSDRAREILENLEKASRQRLLTLLRLLPPDHPAVRPLQEWANRTTRIDREFRGLDQRTRRARNDLYRKWAHKVCQRYATVNVEALSLKEMSEQEKRSKQLELAEKQRAFACLSVLRQYLKEASSKAQGKYIEREAAGSSAYCAEHRVRLTGPRGALVLTCPRGCQVDRDLNAARNLLYNQASVKIGAPAQNEVGYACKRVEKIVFGHRI